MKAITPAAIRARGFTDFITATAPIFENRRMLVRRFGDIDAAVAWLRTAPKPIYIMEPTPDSINESAGWQDFRLRYSVGPVSD